MTNRRPTHGTARKSHRTFTVTRHQKDKSKVYEISPTHDKNLNMGSNENDEIAEIYDSAYKNLSCV